MAKDIILWPNNCTSDEATWVCEHVTDAEAKEGRKVRICDACFFRVGHLGAKYVYKIVLRPNPNNGFVSWDCQHTERQNPTYAGQITLCEGCADALVEKDAQYIYSPIPEDFDDLLDLCGGNFEL